MLDIHITDTEVGKRGSKILCHICGHWDELDFCSQCGTTFTRYGKPLPSAWQAAKTQITELLGEFLQFVFALLKTTWLLIFKPHQFFGALFRAEEPIHNINFPLTGLWNHVSPHSYHYVLSPAKYLLTTLLITFYFHHESFIDRMGSAFGTSISLGNISSGIIKSIQTESFFLTILFAILILLVLVSKVCYFILTFKQSPIDPTAPRLAGEHIYTLFVYTLGPSILLLGFSIQGLSSGDQSPLIIAAVLFSSLATMLMPIHSFFVLPFKALTWLPKWRVLLMSVGALAVWLLIGALMIQVPVILGIIGIVILFFIVYAPQLIAFAIAILLTRVAFNKLRAIIKKS